MTRASDLRRTHSWSIQAVSVSWTNATLNKTQGVASVIVQIPPVLQMGKKCAFCAKSSLIEQLYKVEEGDLEFQENTLFHQDRIRISVLTTHPKSKVIQ